MRKRSLETIACKFRCSLLQKEANQLSGTPNYCGFPNCKFDNKVCQTLTNNETNLACGLYLLPIPTEYLMHTKQTNSLVDVYFNRFLYTTAKLSTVPMCWLPKVGINSI